MCLCLNWALYAAHVAEDLGHLAPWETQEPSYRKRLCHRCRGGAREVVGKWWVLFLLDEGCRCLCDFLSGLCTSGGVHETASVPELYKVVSGCFSDATGFQKRSLTLFFCAQGIVL